MSCTSEAETLAARRRAWIAAAVVVALAAATSRAGETSLAEVRQAIDRGNAEYVAACAKRDATAFAAVYAPEAARLEHGGQVVRGRKAIETNSASLWAKLSGPITVVANTTDVWLMDDLAYESGAYDITASSASGTKHAHGHYLTVWQKQADGGWRIYRDVDVAQD